MIGLALLSIALSLSSTVTACTDFCTDSQLVNQCPNQNFGYNAQQQNYPPATVSVWSLGWESEIADNVYEFLFGIDASQSLGLDALSEISIQNFDSPKGETQYIYSLEKSIFNTNNPAAFAVTLDANGDTSNAPANQICLPAFQVHYEWCTGAAANAKGCDTWKYETSYTYSLGCGEDTNGNSLTDFPTYCFPLRCGGKPSSESPLSATSSTSTSQSTKSIASTAESSTKEVLSSATSSLPISHDSSLEATSQTQTSSAPVSAASSGSALEATSQTPSSSVPASSVNASSVASTAKISSAPASSAPSSAPRSYSGNSTIPASHGSGLEATSQTPTSSAPALTPISTTIISATVCIASSCSATDITTGVAVVTTTVDKVETIYTTYCPITASEGTATTPISHGSALEATSQTPTVTPIGTTVLKASLCASNTCTPTSITTGLAVVTATVDEVVTVYTTYCPITAEEALSSASPSSKGHALEATSATIITVQSCSNYTCVSTRVTTGVVIQTTTINGVVTELTTYCPFASSTEALNNVVTPAAANTPAPVSATQTAAPVVQTPAPASSLTTSFISKSTAVASATPSISAISNGSNAIMTSFSGLFVAVAFVLSMF